MDPALSAVVAAIHASPLQAVINVTGGASQAIGWLLSTPGASKTVLAVAAPYSRRSLVNLLGKAPGQFASEETARALATAAFRDGLKLAHTGSSVVGIGCSCALASVPARRGADRCFISARTQTHIWDYSATFRKGGKSRWEQDEVASRMLVQVLQEVSGVEGGGRLGTDAESALEEVGRKHQEVSREEQLALLLRGEIPLVTFAGLQSAAAPAPSGRRVILCGSFNPLHKGHLQLMDAAARRVEGALPVFEMTAVNADKPSLDVGEVLRRAKQFEDRGLALAVTNEPLFARKAEILPDSTFVLGYDTAVRLLAPKYYSDSEEKMIEVLLRMGDCGCDFVVAGRTVDGAFKVLENSDIPTPIAHLFRESLREADFRVDISSTELRRLVPKA